MSRAPQVTPLALIVGPPQLWQFSDMPLSPSRAVNSRELAHIRIPRHCGYRVVTRSTSTAQPVYAHSRPEVDDARHIWRSGFTLIVPVLPLFLA